MKQTIALLTILIGIMTIVATGGEEVTYIQPPPYEHSSNYNRTMDMAGHWHFWYWLEKRWDDTFSFDGNTIKEFDSIPDQWGLTGMNAYGSPAVAGYDISADTFVIYTENNHFSELYMFNLNAHRDAVTSGCYYQGDLDGNIMTGCFDLNGERTASSEIQRALMTDTEDKAFSADTMYEADPETTELLLKMKDLL